jgi:outer membrane lipoprotein-sorting protein
MAAYQATPENQTNASTDGPTGAAPQPKPQPQPQPKPLTAAETFQQMEAALTKAQTLQCVHELTTKAGDKSMTMKGKLWLGGGGKVRMEVNMDVPGKGAQGFAMISDGKQMVMVADKQAKPGKLAKNMDRTFAILLARSGLALPLYSLQEKEAQPNPNAKPTGADCTPAAAAEAQQELDAAALYKVSDFKLGKTEAVAGKQAAVLHYALTEARDNMPMPTTVWIDPVTHLPLKRVLAPALGGGGLTITETYSEWVVNGKIAPDTFKIPAK